MNKKRSIIILFPLFLLETLTSCVKQPQTSQNNSSASQVVFSPQTKEVRVTRHRQIKQDTTTLSKILQQKGLLEQMDRWNGKALFVKVDETKTPPEFRYYHYNDLVVDQNKNGIVDSADRGFFNPASTVKVGISALVLEKLKQMNLRRETEYRVLGTSQWYTIADDIGRALVISDNESTNRLILFLGFERLNQKMKEKGLQYFFVERLMLDKGTLIDSPPIELSYNNKVTRQPKQAVQIKPSCWEKGQKVGNCASATDLAEVLMRVVQPELYSANENFDLRQEDRVWLQQVMSHTPRQEGFNNEDDACRFLHPLSKKLIHQSGRMLSKCGIGLFSNAYVDTSFIETDNHQKYYLVFALTPPQGTDQSTTTLWMNKAVELIVPQLP